MIIDSHVLILNTTKPGEIVRAEEIIDMMNSLKVDKSVVFNLTPFVQVKNHDYTEANKEVANEVKRFPDRLIGFARTNPWLRDKAVKDLEYAVRVLGLKGLKLHPTVDWIAANHEWVFPLADLCGKLKVPIIMHTYEAGKAMPALTADLAERFPETKIIMSHMGGSLYFAETIVVSKNRENLYLSTAGVYQPRMIKTAVNKLGAHRIIYGSDFPYGNPETEITKVEASGIAEEEKDLVMGKNMASLLGLKA